MSIFFLFLPNLTLCKKNNAKIILLIILYVFSLSFIYIYLYSFIYRMRQNPDKSNNFSKRNFINEKIEYYKKFFHVLRSESLQNIIIQYSLHQFQLRPLFSI